MRCSSTSGRLGKLRPCITSVPGGHLPSRKRRKRRPPVRPAPAGGRPGSSPSVANRQLRRDPDDVFPARHRSRAA